MHNQHPYNTNKPAYEITKKFISGLLKGLATTEITQVEYRLGEVYDAACCGSSYRITSIVERPWWHMIGHLCP